MKNSHYILAASLLFSACGQNSTVEENVKEAEPIAKNSDWMTRHLKGKVKTIEQTSFTPDSTGQISEMDSCCIKLTSFDANGFVEMFSEKDADGANPMELKFERLEDNKFKSATRFRNGEMKWKRTTTYDENGNTLHAIDTDSAGQVTNYYSEITENEIGQVLKGKMHTADSTYLGTWSRKYIDGMRAGRGWVDSTGTELRNRTGELNEKGLLSKMTDYRVTEEGATTTVKTYTYDSFDEVGNWTQRTEYDEEGKATNVKKQTYTYYKED